MFCFHQALFHYIEKHFTISWQWVFNCTKSLRVYLLNDFSLFDILLWCLIAFFSGGYLPLFVTGNYMSVEGSMHSQKYRKYILHSQKYSNLSYNWISINLIGAGVLSRILLALGTKLDMNVFPDINTRSSGDIGELIRNSFCPCCIVWQAESMALQSSCMPAAILNYLEDTSSCQSRSGFHADSSILLTFSHLEFRHRNNFWLFSLLCIMYWRNGYISGNAISNNLSPLIMTLKFTYMN